MARKPLFEFSGCCDLRQLLHDLEQKKRKVMLWGLGFRVLGFRV